MLSVGNVTETLKEVSTCRDTADCYVILNQLEFTRYYKDINMYKSNELEVIPVLERDAYMGVTTNASHTYNVVVVRPTSCAVIQYFPRKVYPTGRARECSISMIRARDTGSGELNITIDHLSEYSNQCTQLQPALRIDRQWTLLLGSETSQSYVISDLVPQCSQVSAYTQQQLSPSIIDLLHTRHTEVSKEYITNTFFGSRPKLNKYVHSLSHAILMNAINPFSNASKQFGIGHVKSLEYERYMHDSFALLSHHQLQTVIEFWTKHCAIHMSVIFVYELSTMEFSTDMYHLRFTSRLQPGNNLTYTQPFFYFRRYIILQVHGMTSSTPLICKVCFSVDIKRQFGMLQVTEEIRRMRDSVWDPNENASVSNHVYIAWGYRSLRWNEANAKCSAMGGYLPSVTTKEEIDFLEKACLGKIHTCPAENTSMQIIVCGVLLLHGIR